VHRCKEDRCWTLSRQFELMSKLPGLMSRWRMLAECRYFSPATQQPLTTHPQNTDSHSRSNPSCHFCDTPSLTVTSVAPSISNKLKQHFTQYISYAPHVYNMHVITCGTAWTPVHRRYIMASSTAYTWSHRHLPEQVYLLMHMDRAIYLIKLTTSRSTPSVITKQYALVNSTLLHRPTAVSY